MNVENILQILESGVAVRFNELVKICEKNFGKSRVSGSHHIFKTPWQGDPRVNLQKGKGNTAKPYQVRQVLNALRKLQELKNREAAEKNE